MDYVAQIGQTVRQLRQNKRLTQTVVAKHVGWHQPALSEFERGKRKSLDVNDLKAMAEVLEVSPVDLLGNKEGWSMQSPPAPHVAPVIDKVTRLDPSQQEKVWKIFAEIVALM